MGRCAEREEITGLAAYLCADEAGYIMGANVAINGGMCVS